eukprot:TRINITY_DN2848_c0_g1_i1.p1 TRINITY_DN2848_c0_g1~~TRINITY_DN2848_c0_g1_i1.p1  ORF type:complete len:399 (+),score=166.08 TRINITY_DN2848_c0_g1_i1:42-1238(+)
MGRLQSVKLGGEVDGSATDDPRKLPKLYKTGREWLTRGGQLPPGAEMKVKLKKPSKVVFPQLPELKNPPQDPSPMKSPHSHEVFGMASMHRMPPLPKWDRDPALLAEMKCLGGAVDGPGAGVTYAEYDLEVLRLKATRRQKQEKEVRRERKEAKRKQAQEASVQLMNDIDEFTLKHVQKQARRQSAEVTAEVGRMTRGDAWNKYRDSLYADLWKRMGAPAISNMYESITGGVNYKMTPSMWTALHDELGEDDPALMEEVQRKYPNYLSELYTAVDLDGDEQILHTEFMAFMAGLWNTPNTLRTLTTLYQHLGIDGRLFAPLSFDEVCEHVLPHVPKGNVAQMAWRDTLEQLVALTEKAQSTEAWTFDVFLKTLYLFSSRSLDSRFSGLTIRKKQEQSA